MFKTKYRIVTDLESGYSAQHKRWWCPFWIGVFKNNTYTNIEAAKKLCVGRRVVWEKHKESDD